MGHLIQLNSVWPYPALVFKQKARYFVPFVTSLRENLKPIWRQRENPHQFVYFLLFFADRRLRFAADNASLETILNVTKVFHNKKPFPMLFAAKGV